MRSLALLAALALAAPAAHAQNAWVVAGAPGPGVDFVNLQTAIDAAADGDVLVLREAFGGYDGATIFAKGLTLIADKGASPRVRSMSIRQLAADQRVVISNVDFWNTTLGVESGLNLRSSGGTVWLEDCELRGKVGWLVPGPGGVLIGAQGEPGLDILDVAEVSVTRCTIEGGDGYDVFTDGAWTGFGGDGIRSSGATRLSVHSSTLRGGDGGAVDPDTTGADGSAGGHGLSTNGGVVQLIGCDVRGGDGGQGGNTLDPFTQQPLCGAGGAGGDALGTHAGGVVAAELRVGSSALAWGVGGPGCGPGAPGQLVGAGLPSATQLATSAAATSLDGPFVEGQTMTYRVEGALGSLALVAIGGGPAQLDVPSLTGALLVDPTGAQLQLLGATPATLHVTAPQIAASPGVLEAFVQVVVFDQALGTTTLGEPTYVLIVDSAAL